MTSKPFRLDVNPQLERAETFAPGDYTDPAMLKLEKERIFRRTWQLAGTLSTVVRNYGDVFAYFAGVQAAVARALARRRIISFVKSSRVKVHWNGAADFS